MRAMSRNILTEIKDNLDKNQKARNELYDLLDKAYYVDSIKYKIDHITTYPESSSE
jgi:predicted component of type VI protein secretion system